MHQSKNKSKFNRGKYTAIKISNFISGFMFLLTEIDKITHIFLNYSSISNSV